MISLVGIATLILIAIALSHQRRSINWRTVSVAFVIQVLIGAFALSNNMVVIALGLSIGAMFVRSMTIMLVQKGTLAEYRFLEHGAVAVSQQLLPHRPIQKRQFCLAQPAV